MYVVMSMNKVQWKQIEKSKEISAHIAYYYSDQESELPVRDVRKKRDNKADPNIETKTYGLFSTCMPPARRNMVDYKNWYIFFFTNRKSQRMFTGYYELDKSLVTGITPRNKLGSYKFSDHALLAKRTHFVKNGIPLLGKLWSKIPYDAVKNDGVLGYGPRDFKSMHSKFAIDLKEKLDEQEDITDEYVKEIHRLENDNLEKSNNKFKYPSWERKDAFTNKDIVRFIK